MRINSRYLRLFPALLITLDASALDQAEGVLATFGTPYSSDYESRGRDRGSLIAESDSGVIWVAGIADAFPSDTGGAPGKPLLANFGPDGKMQWQQVYDRPGWSILGINPSSKIPSVILWFPEPGRWYQLDTEHEHYYEHGRAELWTVKPGGELGDKQMTLHHRVSSVNASTTHSGFSLTLGEPVHNENPYRIRLRTHSYDWGGRKLRVSDTFSLPSFPDALADELGAVASDLDLENNKNTFLQYRNLTTRKSTRINIGDCSLCRMHDVHRVDNTLIALVTRGDWNAPFRTAFLFTLEPETGTIKQTIEIPEVAQLDGLRLFATSDHVFISGNDYLASFLLKVSLRDRSVNWVKRFLSGTSRLSVADLVNLKDGRIAMTGSGEQSSAVLLLSDAKGNFLDHHAACISPGFSLATLRHRLATQRLVNLYVNPNYVRELAEQRHSAKQPDPPKGSCDPHNEWALIDFGEALLDSPIDIDASKLAVKSMITIKPDTFTYPAGQSFRYIPQHSSSGVPTLLADLKKAGAVARELEENILPYMAFIEDTSEQFFYSSRHVFSSGNSLAQSIGHHWKRRQPLAVSPAEYTQAIKILSRNLNALDEYTRQKIKRSVNRMNIVAIVPGSGLTRRTRTHTIELPLTNIDAYWQWIQGESRLLAESIFEAETRLGHALNIAFINAPEIEPENYLVFLETLLIRMETLERSGRRVELEFSGRSEEQLSIRLQNKEQCHAVSSHGLNVDDLAKQLTDDWACISRFDH